MKVIQLLLFVVFLFPKLFYGQINCLEKAKKINKVDSAIIFLEKCINKNGIVNAKYVDENCYLANLYAKKGHKAKAERLLINLLSLTSRNSNKELTGKVHQRFGGFYKLSADNASALSNYLAATKIFQEGKSYSNLISVYTDMAELYRSLANYDEARYYIKKGFEIFRKTGEKDALKLAKLYNRYAAIENEQNEMDSSIYFTMLAIKFAKEAGDKYSEATSFNELGFSYKNLKMVDTSFNCYQRAIDLWESIGAESEEIHAKFNQTQLLAHNNYPNRKIIPLYKNIIDEVIAKKIDYPLNRLYAEISWAYFFVGDSLNCYRYRAASINETIKIERARSESEVNEVKEKYENEKYKKEISKVSDKLNRSEKELLNKKQENLFIYLFLILLSVLLALIGYLLYRIYKTNKALHEKNLEKDTLVQEIHHRVKNNLQFVESLINLQMKSTQSDSEKNTLSDVSRRIKSMGLVHQMLYSKNDLYGVEIKTYFSELISSLNELVNSQKIPIQFNLSCPELKFKTTEAIALGLITSELISNSIKYAFQNVGKPVISITLTLREDKTISFVIKDNGAGFSKHDILRGGSLGMRLIDIFSRQIRGEYEFDSTNGLTYTLKFKYEQ